MNVEHLLASEVDEQVLAEGVRALDDPSVEQRCALDETPLRAGDQRLATGEGVVQRPREPMQGVPLRH